MQERVQKIISSCGLMSRRAAETAIVQGRVTVNGAVCGIGQQADITTDVIEVDGVKLALPEEHVYIMLNKPKGYVTTLSDEKGRKNVAELVSELGVRLYPVGRLDINSEGLLIMTNDGDFANRVMHPSGEILKTYRTWVTGDDISSAVDVLRGICPVDGVNVRARSVCIIKKEEHAAVLDITIGEGRNRQVRKMCDYAGLTVTRLCRIKEGSLELGNLGKKCWRYLTEEEINSFERNTENE